MLLSGRTRVAGLILLLSGISSALPANDAGLSLQLARIFHEGGTNYGEIAGISKD